jgi:hypothetical protein
MKKITFLLIAVCCAWMGAFNTAGAQCPNNNNQFGTSPAPTVPGASVTLSTCIFGGEYRLMTGLQAGVQYRFETCGDTDFDTQITIYNDAGGAALAYNDDFCGLQSSVDFTPSSTGNYRILIDRFFCASQNTCMTLRATRITGAGPAQPTDDCATAAQSHVVRQYLVLRLVIILIRVPFVSPLVAQHQVAGTPLQLPLLVL